VTSTASSVNKQKLQFAPNVYSDFKSGLALPVQIMPPFVFKKAGHRLEEWRQFFFLLNELSDKIDPFSPAFTSPSMTKDFTAFITSPLFHH